MRKFSKELILVLLFTSMFFPILSTVVKAETDDEDIPLFRVGVCGPRSIASWDAVTYVVSDGDYYLQNSLEYLMQYSDTSTSAYEDLVPVLATDWDIENRTSEMNDAGFMSYDGVKSIELTLREGVTFHDGSAWNATVCKWNMDRYMYLTGNIGGCLGTLAYSTSTRTAIGTWWLEEKDWVDYSTANWDVSAMTMNYYEGFGAAPCDGKTRFPRIQRVTITEDQASGGKVKVDFNDWRTGVYYIVGMRFISRDAYKDYFDVGIVGYGDDLSFPQGDTSTFPGHLIGTGPYKFNSHDYSSGIGTMSRNEDWWNATAQQADGWFVVPEVAVATFPHTTAGYQERSAAMVTSDIDFAFDHSWEPVNYEDMVKAKHISYVPLGTESYGENIILNCIDETFYKTYYQAMGINYSAIVKAVSPVLVGAFKTSGNIFANDTINVNGVNRAFRKAISYAFDYDTFIHTAMNDRIVRSGGTLPSTHENYNPTIPIATRDLTIARQALLDDPYWSVICADRGLDSSSTTEEWRAVADDDPIYEFEYQYDQAHLDARNIMTESLKDIGCVIDANEDVPDTYTKMTSYFTYPWFHADGFSLKFFHRKINDHGYIQAYYKSGEITAPFPAGTFNNMAFCYNDTCDELITKYWFQNATGRQYYYDKLCDWIQNYQYPCIFIGQDLIGIAINKNWDFMWFWETFRFNLVKVGPGVDEGIPGFPFAITVAATLIGLLGVMYIIIRKNKRM